MVNAGDELEFFRHVGIGSFNFPPHFLAVHKPSEVRCHRNEGFQEKRVFFRRFVEGNFQYAFLFSRLKQGNEEFASHYRVYCPCRWMAGEIFHPEWVAGPDALGCSDFLPLNDKPGKITVVSAEGRHVIFVSFHG